MNTELQKVETQEILTEKKIMEYLDIFGYANKLSSNEKKQFIEIAVTHQLNPFKREIHCVPYGDGENRRLSIITGYEIYLKRAERTGLLDGWFADIEKSETDIYAVVTIHRKDWQYPFVHKAYLSEVNRGTKVWKEMPRFMLRKVAIAQAFRMCFPDDVGGMPYLTEEVSEDLQDNFMESNLFTESEFAEMNNKAQEADVKTTKNTDVSKEDIKKTVEKTSTTTPSNGKGTPHMLTEGEVLEKWFWNIDKAERKKYLPAGCGVHRGEDGTWYCKKN